MKFLAVFAGALMVAPVAASACRDVYIENACWKPVSMIVEASNAYRDWDVFGWYKVAAGQRTRLLAGSSPLCHRRDHHIYFYAESDDGRFEWRGEDTKAKFEGTVYHMRQANTRNYRGGTLISITCE